MLTLNGTRASGHFYPHNPQMLPAQMGYMPAAASITPSIAPSIAQGQAGSAQADSFTGNISGRQHPAMQRLQAERHKEAGNHYRKLQMNDMAIAEYMQAIQYDPSYTDAYYNLAKTYVTVGDSNRAVEAMHRLLMADPYDHESRVFLAEMLTEQGQYDHARKHYQYVLSQVPSFDPAARNLKLMEHLEKNKGNPLTAAQELKAQGEATLQVARGLMQQFYQSRSKPEMIDLLARTPVEFSPTQRIKQVTNMAEFDFFRGGVIRLAPELAFAAPNVMAAYLIHEMEHAKDKDGLSSVTEEQDGYRELARFWVQAKGNTVEPNLDLASRLFSQSRDLLDARVRELYVMRDPLLPEKSPGHGMPYGTSPVGLQESYEMEKLVKYTNLVYERIKTLLPAYGLNERGPF